MGLHDPPLKSGLFLPGVHLLVPSKPQPRPKVPLWPSLPRLTSPGAAVPPPPGQQADLLCVRPKTAVHLPQRLRAEPRVWPSPAASMYTEIQGHRCEALGNLRRPALPPARLWSCFHQDQNSERSLQTPGTLIYLGSTDESTPPQRTYTETGPPRVGTQPQRGGAGEGAQCLSRHFRAPSATLGHA